MTTSKTENNIDRFLLWVPLVLIAILTGLLVSNKDVGNAILNTIFSTVTGGFGWLYQLYTFGFFILFLYFAFGKYSSKRMGSSKPEYKTFTWWALMTTSTTSAGLLYWSSIEFYYYISAPPFGAVPFSVQAYDWSGAYVLLHWGVTPLAMYTVLGVVFGYYFFVLKKDVVRPSTICDGVVGDRVNGWLGKTIDVFFIFSIVCGVGTSLGLGTPLVAECIHALFGIPHTIMLDIILVLCWTIFFATTLYLGLEKGVSRLSDIRMWISIFVIAYLIIVGPRAFMFNQMTDSIGMFLQNIFRMSFYTDPYAATGFPQEWTIFYWAWFIAYAITYGMFLARLSKGRTVREFVTASMVGGSLGSFIFFWVLGNFNMVLNKTGVVDIGAIMQSGGAPAAIVACWQHYPGAIILFPILGILTFICAATSLNGAAFTLAMVTTKNNTENPAKWTRVIWALLLGFVAITLTFLGTLKAVKTASVLGSFPLIFITIIMMVSFFKVLQKMGWEDHEQVNTDDLLKNKKM
ncbi:L-carnitine/gamma-butyrobetaine antiporter [Pectinatus frisingensis]|uniref:L-carnitine/gamma-butyrobetaine antiporter n=1 Tax=Pectinatus frisingensis TaxID=865 RepID=UPI0015F73398|nr:L-carnitine/gamma-butyrobetaine antiporter [Pectinatus frisingensis]